MYCGLQASDCTLRMVCKSTDSVYGLQVADQALCGAVAASVHAPFIYHILNDDLGCCTCCRTTTASCSALTADCQSWSYDFYYRFACLILHGWQTACTVAPATRRLHAPRATCQASNTIHAMLFVETMATLKCMPDVLMHEDQQVVPAKA